MPHPTKVLIGTSPMWEDGQRVPVWGWPPISSPWGNNSLERILTPRLGEFSDVFLVGDLSCKLQQMSNVSLYCDISSVRTFSFNIIISMYYWAGLFFFNFIAQNNWIQSSWFKTTCTCMYSHGGKFQFQLNPSPSPCESMTINKFE